MRKVIYNSSHMLKDKPWKDGNSIKCSKITVFLFSEPPKILEWRELVEVTEGRNVKLECHVPINISSTVKISWFKDDKLLPYDTSSIRYYFLEWTLC